VPHIKRKLTEEELKQVRKWLEEAPQGRKPSIRQIARALGVNKPSVIKSLGGWKGIQRNAPEKPFKPKFPMPDLRQSESIIKPAQFDVPEELK